jgi:1-deoxyxylulose-5-phosphate synthase
MGWIATIPEERRRQLGSFLLGTGGIGGIAATTGPGIGLSQEEGHKLIDRALDKEGIKVLDTADMYAAGASERIVGAWNAAHPDADVLIQTKTGVTAEGPNLAPDRVRRQLAHSVAVLGRVDLYIAHQADPNTPWAESLPVFSHAVESGVIRAYGLSNVDGAALSSALETADRLKLVRPELIQNQYSLLARGDDRDVLPIVRSEGLAYTPFSPLATGLLAGRYSNGEQPGHGSRASIASRHAHYFGDEQVMVKVRAFDRLAAEHEVTSAGLALAWLVNHPLVTAPIVGPSKESQWTAVHEAQKLPWTSQLADRLDSLFS